MLRRSLTAVLEKNSVFQSNFETEPYETAWASEARFFIRILDIAPTDGVLLIHPQLSPDGLFWCDEGREALRIEGKGLHTFSLREFGHWLRLRTEVQAESVKLMIYLALKE